VLRSSSAPRLQDGWTPLYAASSNGHAETVKALIEGRADLEAKKNVRMDGARVRSGEQGVAIQTDTDGAPLMPDRRLVRESARHYWDTGGVCLWSHRRLALYACCPRLVHGSTRVHVGAGRRVQQLSGSLWARDARSLSFDGTESEEGPAGALWRHVRRGQRRPEAMPGTACSALVFTCVCSRVSACIYVSVSVQMYFICIRACMYVYACMRVCVYVAMSPCACVHACICRIRRLL
jgi:hypothetical protein